MYLDPVKHIETQLDSGAKVNVVLFSNDQFGLECFNSKGVKTRAVFSRDAALAIGVGFGVLSSGGGEVIEREWQVIPSDEIIRYTSTDDRLIGIPLSTLKKTLIALEFFENHSSFISKEEIAALRNIIENKE